MLENCCTCPVRRPSTGGCTPMRCSPPGGAATTTAATLPAPSSALRAHDTTHIRPPPCRGSNHAARPGQTHNSIPGGRRPAPVPGTAADKP
nr:MAG TPA: hypothetical protein [Caudoviricetes sp.]